MTALDAHPPQRHVLVGVCGGIAIYKAVELVRLLAKEGFAPTVVTTAAGKRFIMPLTFAAVFRQPAGSVTTSVVRVGRVVRLTAVQAAAPPGPGRIGRPYPTRFPQPCRGTAGDAPAPLVTG